MNDNPREYPTGQSRSMGGTAEQDKGMVEKAQDAASALMDKAKGKAQEWGSAAADVAGQARDKAQEWASTAADKAQDFGQEMTSMIRRYPIQSVLIGLGLGFVLAQVMRRD